MTYSKNSIIWIFIITFFTLNIIHIKQIIEISGVTSEIANRNRTIKEKQKQIIARKTTLDTMTVYAKIEERAKTELGFSSGENNFEYVHLNK